MLRFLFKACHQPLLFKQQFDLLLVSSSLPFRFSTAALPSLTSNLALLLAGISSRSLPAESQPINRWLLSDPRFPASIATRCSLLSALCSLLAVRYSLLSCAIYEHKTIEPIPTSAFARRILLHLVIATVFLIASLLVGIWGYASFEGLSLEDGFLNSAMLLGGMGPVNMPVTENGKLFAGIYALYSGLVFLAVTALMLAPIAHRVLHTFHWEE